MSPDNPFAELEKLFHEPNRLAIMSLLCGAEEGVWFGELKVELQLTDGNLSRHLKALEEAGAVLIDKQFVDNKPRTTIHVTDAGRDNFVRYLQTLEKVLKTAAKSLKAKGRGLNVPFDLAPEKG